jgi:cyclase
MLTKRIIPCLDIKTETTVSGTGFNKLQYVGDPVYLASWYDKEGADELIFLDITATTENRKLLTDLVHRISLDIKIPFTIGGGISSIYDVESLLNVGADKVSINTSAFYNPMLINTLVKHFGSQCIVLAVDAMYELNQWIVYTNGGRIKTNVSIFTWIQEAVERGVGEILLTSINNDGKNNGFAIDIIRQISENITIPVIASGGAGELEDFYDIFKYGKADAALASSIFHYKKFKISNLKFYLKNKNIPIRY